jgi:hypothetical protein
MLQEDKEQHRGGSIYILPSYQFASHINKEKYLELATDTPKSDRIHISFSLGVRYCRAPKRDEVTGAWRKLYNEDQHNSYPSPSIIRIIKSRTMRWAGHCSTNGEKRNAILVGKPEGKRPLGRLRGRCVDNIKMDWSDSG